MHVYAVNIKLIWCKMKVLIVRVHIPLMNVSFTVHDSYCLHFDLCLCLGQLRVCLASIGLGTCVMYVESLFGEPVS